MGIAPAPRTLAIALVTRRGACLVRVPCSWSWSFSGSWDASGSGWEWVPGER
jgi:hypothetical protein